MQPILVRLCRSTQIRSCVRMASTNANTGRLDGKVAVVTASTDGIGLGIAEKLGRDGAKVVISSRNQNNVDKALAKLKDSNIDVYGTVCHVSKPEDRKRMLDEAEKQYGGIDILVSNAGTNPQFGEMLDTTEDQWDKIFDTNVKSSFFFIKDGVPYLRKRGGGAIVFVSSYTGYTPVRAIPTYSVSKTALLGLTKALAPQCAVDNIRVNCIAPGIIETKFSNALTSNDYISEQMMAQTPLARYGTPKDCAGVVSFLCSDDASYITGETIVVAGGMPCRL